MKKFILIVIIIFVFSSKAWPVKLKCKRENECSIKAEEIYRSARCCIELDINTEDNKRCFRCIQKNVDKKVFIYWESTWEE